MKKLFFTTLILAFLASETALYLNKLAGFFSYIILVGIILASLEKDEIIDSSEKLLIFLTVIPIARISEFFIDFSFFWKIFVFYSVVLFLAIFYTRKFQVKHGYSIKNFNFITLSLFLGVFLGYGGDNFFNFEKHFEILMLIPIIVFSEEILFRGMIQNFAKKQFGSLFSIIAVALLVSIFSLSFGGIKFAYFMLMCNLIMCLIYDRTENIWLTIQMSLFLNIFLFVMNFNV